jgi:hypothetical protein
MLRQFDSVHFVPGLTDIPVQSLLSALYTSESARKGPANVETFRLTPLEYIVLSFLGMPYADFCVGNLPTVRLFLIVASIKTHATDFSQASASLSMPD